MCDTFVAIQVAGTAPSRWKFNKLCIHDNRYNGYDDESTNSYDIHITNSDFNTNGSGGQFSGLLVVSGSGAYRYNVSNCNFSGNSYRVKLVNVLDSNVSNINIYDSSNGFTNGGISFEGCTNVVSSDVTIDTCGGIGAEIRENQTGSVPSHAVTLKNYSITACSGYSIGISYVHHCAINGGIIYNPAAAADRAVYLGADADDFEIMGLRIIDDRAGSETLDYGIYAPSATSVLRLRIRDCTFVGCTAAAIQGSDVTKDGWQITNCYFACPTGIYLGDGDDWFISGNRFVCSTVGVNIDRAAAVRTVVVANTFKGSADEEVSTSATNKRVHDNIDKDGAWYAET
jgi:hypothetical protein